MEKEVKVVELTEKRYILHLMGHKMAEIILEDEYSVRRSTGEVIVCGNFIEDLYFLREGRAILCENNEIVAGDKIIKAVLIEEKKVKHHITIEKCLRNRKIPWFLGIFTKTIKEVYYQEV